MTLQSINPYNGDTITTYQPFSAHQTEIAIQQAESAFKDWRLVPFAERRDRLKKAAEILQANAREYAHLMALEMGKPVQQGRAESEKCAWVCDYYAEHGEMFLQPEEIQTDAQKSYVSYSPLGVILGIMPWNFPFWQVFRFVAPTLMAGNTILLKHASNVSGCALAIEELLEKAGFPPNVFQTLLIPSKDIQHVIADSRIQGVSLTGSTAAGRAVASMAGKHLKKCVLELGGSDAYVVLEDADLEQAAKICVQGRLVNTGQSCIAAKRFIVPEAKLREFEERVVALFSDQRAGDPMDENTTLGPLARLDLREQLHQQVQKSKKLGARLLLGGEIPKGPGAFYPATVLSDVKSGMPAYEEELFGPVAAIIPAFHETMALELANDSVFGLGAAVLTADPEKGERIARDELQAGCCFVNAFVRSDPRLPFGGIKESGYGRELSRHGIREFVNAKTVYVSH
ncbi:aldehyde dehydrogenase family protein [candidate division KSB1 bacterium]|nr:aldehyde dehydrogenase family protein [candidate division KSB1 bacterium]